METISSISVEEKAWWEQGISTARATIYRKLFHFSSTTTRKNPMDLALLIFHSAKSETMAWGCKLPFSYSWQGEIQRKSIGIGRNDWLARFVVAAQPRLHAPRNRCKIVHLQTDWGWVQEQQASMERLVVSLVGEGPMHLGAAAVANVACMHSPIDVPSCQLLPSKGNVMVFASTTRTPYARLQQSYITRTVIL